MLIFEFEVCQGVWFEKVKRGRIPTQSFVQLEGVHLESQQTPYSSRVHSSASTAATVAAEAKI